MSSEVQKKGHQDQQFVDEQVRAMMTLRPHYQDFCEALKSVLEHAMEDLGIIAIVQVRAKTVGSFAEKCIRKRNKYPKPAYQLGDLCGGRVIVESADKIVPVCRFIREHFEIEEASSEDVAQRLQAHEFGYQSVHFTVSFRSDIDYHHGLIVPPELLARRSAEDAQQEGLSPGPKYKAEVQVRTLLQHAWADLAHDSLYKTELKKKPRHLEREAGRIAALLEDADNAFVRLLEGVDTYRSCFGAYMETDDIVKEIATLDVVRKHDASEQLAHKIARLAMAIEDWATAEQALANFGKSKNAGVQRDLGWAQWQLGKKKEGRTHLELATKLDPHDADAFCVLGDTYNEEKKRRQALKQYQQAFQACPTHPRALVNFARCEIIENKNVGFLSFAKPTLERAIALSSERARYGMHLPWAWYDIGFLNLLLGQPYAGLTAYAKAVQLSPTETALVETRRALDEVQAAFAGRQADLADHVKWARWFLSVAIVAKLLALEAEAPARLEKAVEAKSKADKNLEEAKLAADDEKLSEARQEADKAATALLKAEKYLAEIKKKAAEAPKEWLGCGDEELDGGTCLATAAEPGAGPLFDKERPVVIVAGGCDASVQTYIEEYRLLIHQAFTDFRGTIISGGTTAGIPGIVGDLPVATGEVLKVAYLPSNPPRGDREHEGYNVFRPTAHVDYSPLDPIQVWIDLLCTGIRPGDVRLLGINGGEISAFEYRLALVLGAQTGILCDSGREASRIAADPDWKDTKGLLLLPTDRETVTAFLQPAECSAMISAEAREAMARHAHEAYRKNQEERYLKQHPPMAGWDELKVTYRHANLAQVDHIETKLRRVGLCLRKVTQGTPKLFTFDDAQKTTMAEMEHGRWNTERLQQGWTYGKEKDEDGKRSPYLVAWRDLPDDVRKWDIQAVEDIPKQLAEMGYEIYRPE